MQKENIDKARRIIRTIDENRSAIDWLEKHAKNGHRFYTDYEQFTFSDGDRGMIEIDLEDWEIRLIIHNKKQRIAALGRELEEL